MSRRDPTDLEQESRLRRDADKAEQAARRQAKEDLRWLMSDARGRRVVRRILERAGIWQCAFNGNASHLAFSEGGRNLGLVLMDWVEDAAPALLMQMLSERTSDRRSNDEPGS